MRIGAIWARAFRPVWAPIWRSRRTTSEIGRPVASLYVFGEGAGLFERLFVVVDGLLLRMTWWMAMTVVMGCCSVNVWIVTDSCSVYVA